MSLDVRRVGAESAADVLRVVQAAFGARPALDPPADAMSEDLESVTLALAEHGGILATLDGEPVGCLLLRPRPDGLVLRRFGVVPSAQGHGIARALVEVAVECALGHDSLVVLARQELPETIRFWQSQGFVEAERWDHNVRLRRPLETSYDAADADAMRDLGRRVGRTLVAGDLVVLTGELGAGKTTLTQGLGEGLGVRGAVTSPTFVIARVHPSLVGGPDLVHVDAYRLGGVAELDDLDLDASVESAVTVVEWGAGLAEGLSDSRLEITIERALADDVPDDDAGDGTGDPRRVVLRRHVG